MLGKSKLWIYLYPPLVKSWKMSNPLCIMAQIAQRQTFPYSNQLLYRFYCLKCLSGKTYDPILRTGSPPLYLHFNCKNWGWWGSHEFPFHDGYAPTTPCNPSANASPFVYCFVLLILQCNISHPARPILQIRNWCNMGRVGHINDPWQSSPGATRSHTPFDCCVSVFFHCRVPLDVASLSKAH